MSINIIENLLENPYDYSLFAAISLIQRYYHNYEAIGGLGDPSREVIRLKNSCSLMFPAGEIKSIEQSESESRIQLMIETPSLGLYGVFSPLPLRYTEELISSQEEDQEVCRQLRDFLDIYNHRLLSLAYRVDQYRMLNNNWAQLNDSPMNLIISALSGMPSLFQTGNNEVSDWQVESIKYLVFGTRSASNLRAWLKMHFGHIPISIEEFSPYWVNIPDEEKAFLGVHGCQLASEYNSMLEGITIGDWIKDNETKFRVTVGPLDWETFKSFLPNEENFRKMKSLVSIFSPDWLFYDVIIKLLSHDCYHLQVILNGETSQLGYTAGLFLEKNDGDDFCLFLELGYAA
jgi:type VI secretion system protein ImpH